MEEIETYIKNIDNMSYDELDNSNNLYYSNYNFND